MDAPQKKADIQTDDVDLLSLLERVIAFFKQYKWIFATAVVAGLAIGTYFYYSLSKIYASRLVVHSFFLTNQEEIEIVGNWNKLLKRQEYRALAEIFHCEESMLHKVKEIRAEEIQKTFTPSNPNGFTIDVNITDNSVLPDLQKAIVYGLESGEYVNARMEMKRENYEELIDKTTSEINKLDSNRRLFQNIIGGNEHSSSSLIIDASSLNKQIIEMNEKLLMLKENLKFAQAVEILQDFNQYSQPIGPKLIPWLVIGLILAFALAFVITVIDSVNHRLKQRKRYSILDDQ